MARDQSSLEAESHRAKDGGYPPRPPVPSRRGCAPGGRRPPRRNAPLGELRGERRQAAGRLARGGSQRQRTLCLLRGPRQDRGRAPGRSGHPPGRAEDSERHGALSGWYGRWHSLLSTRAQGCSIAQADVSVELTYRLPRWLHPSGVSPGLVGSWKRYLRALRVHEEGHAENGVRTGSRVLHGLRALPPTPSCKRLENRANGMVANEVARGNSWDIAYDRRTGDGAAQGAVFP
ncbi:MAG: DUF922 domain-containing protein [Gaiellaceae bacterium]